MRYRVLFIFVLLPSYVICNHLVGGSFTVEQYSEDTFYAEITVYRDCSNSDTGFESTWHISVFDKQTHTLLDELGFDVYLTDNYLVEESNSYCSEIPYCRAVGVYNGEFELPPNEGGYYLSKERCCRSQASINVQSENAGMVFTLDVSDPTVINSAPEFNNPDAAPFACLNQATTLDYSAYDSDGDSLVYRSVIPLKGSSTDSTASPIAGPKPYAVLDWEDGFTESNPFGSLNTFELDQQTGIITILPAQTGIYTFALEIEEYRDGIKIGSIRYESQILIGPCMTNYDPILTTAPSSITQSVNMNELYCLSIAVSDQNSDDMISIQGDGVFYDNLDDFNFDFEVDESDGVVNAEFCWIPNENQETGLIYTLEIIVSTFGCSADTVQFVYYRNFIVSDIMSSRAFEKTSEIHIYPNPVTDYLTIVEEKTQLGKTIEIKNSVGQFVHISSFPSNSKTLDISDLPAGLYYLFIKGDNQVILSSKKILIQ